MKYKLSIIVITMNRAKQLVNALQSCFNSTLPCETEFVIVDNASTDNTGETVHELFAQRSYPYKYIKEEENRGVGGGRNIGYEKAEGEFCYFLDDDAIIAPECYETFFTLPLKYFKENENISSITTRIYDEAWKCDREVVYSKIKESAIPAIFMYLGGSHFLRKAHYDEPLYIDIKYGHEEIIPSIYTIDNGHYNCYIHDVNIIHQPKINKWQKGSDIMYDIACNADANILASKYMIYPVVMRPILITTFFFRLIKHFGLNFYWYKTAFRRYRDLIKNNKLRKICLRTVYKLAKEYSLGSAV